MAIINAKALRRKSRVSRYGGEDSTDQKPDATDFKAPPPHVFYRAFLRKESRSNLGTRFVFCGTSKGCYCSLDQPRHHSKTNTKPVPRS